MKIHIQREVTVEGLQQVIEIFRQQGPDFTCSIDAVVTLGIKEAVRSAKNTEHNNGEMQSISPGDEQEVISRRNWMRIGALQEREEQLKMAAERGEYQNEKWADDHRKQIENHHKLNAERVEQARRERVFSTLIAECGDELIKAINTELKIIWDEEKPKYPHDVKLGAKGDPRPVPYLERLDEKVYIQNNPGRTKGKRIKTPLSADAKWSGGMEHHWKYCEWVDVAVPRIEKIIDNFEQTFLLSGTSDS